MHKVPSPVQAQNFTEGKAAASTYTKIILPVLYKKRDARMGHRKLGVRKLDQK
jgi:hypothetical protein